MCNFLKMLELESSVSGNIRTAFFKEKIRKYYFWENIRFFFNIWARKFDFRKYKEFCWGGFFSFGGFEMEIGLDSSITCYFSLDKIAWKAEPVSWQKVKYVIALKYVEKYTYWWWLKFLLIFRLLVIIFTQERALRKTFTYSKSIIATLKKVLNS